VNVCSANRSAVLLLLAHDCSIRLFRFRSKGWTSHRLAVEKCREQGSGSRDRGAGIGEQGSGRAVQLYFGSRGRRWGRLLWVHQFTFLAREDFFDGGKKRP
jgi:hypothetical protein